MKYNVCVVGATGVVGSTVLKVLNEYQFPINKLSLIASSKSSGKVIMYDNKPYTVIDIDNYQFDDDDFTFFCSGGVVSSQYIDKVKKGIVIDNSSYYRMNKDISLIVPEVNIDDYFKYKNKKVIANPNCSTIQMMLPLKALQKEFGLHSISYTTYQAVSGSGLKGITDLNDSEISFYPYDITKTCIPQIDSFLDNGFTKEEFKMINETKKILNQEDLLINATCVRVPVLNSHAVSCEVVLKKDFEIDEIFSLFKETKNVVLIDDVSKLEYPVSTLANNNDLVYVGRIRKSNINQNGLLFYCVADNLRRGAASNAVLIALELIKETNNG